MSSSARWILATILLAPAVVLPLLVGVYDRQTPELWGFPFYYWFQFALIPVAAALTTTAYFVVRDDQSPDAGPDAGPNAGPGARPGARRDSGPSAREPRR